MINPRTLHTFEVEAAELPVGDWTAHRDLAQEAVEAGYAAELTQEVSNDVGDEGALTHSLRFLEPDEVVAFDEGIHESEDAMGGSVSVEQFTPERAHGFYGQRTPLEFSPVQDDWPDTASIRLSHGGKDSVHSTLTQALETVLREQTDLAWIPPKHHAGFDPDGPLRADNDSPLLLDPSGAVVADHVLDAFRAVAVAEGQSITVETGREDLGAVFTASFNSYGEWELGHTKAEASHTLKNVGPIKGDYVPLEVSAAFETHAESVDRRARVEESRDYGQARHDGDAFAEQLLTASSGTGEEANAARLAHATEVVAEYERREARAYADAPSSTQEPYVGPEPVLDRLVIANGGDLNATVHSEDFSPAVQRLLGRAAHEYFVSDEAGGRYEFWQPDEDDRTHVAEAVEQVRARLVKAGVAEEHQAPANSSSPSAASKSVDAQASSSFEQVLKNRPQAGPKAGLNAREPQSDRAFARTDGPSQSKSQDWGLAGPPPF